MPELKTIILFTLLLVASIAQADETTEATKAPSVEEVKSSPWLITPILSSDPKISTSAGILAAYIHKFDKESPPSMFGVMGTYSTTASYKYGAFAKTHFGQDNHRLNAVIASGLIRNDYEDYLGSGLPVQTTDNLKMFMLRYTYRVHGRWYVGPQWISTNYAISGDDALSGNIMEQIGLTGFDSNGLGLYVQFDSRDNQYSPSTGQSFEVHNVAYREALGGDDSFDTLSSNYQYYLPHGKGNVLATRLKGRWTNDAPPGGYSSVDLRGYTRGQYLAPHNTSLELDERIAIKGKWGASLYAGIAVLYGDGSFDATDSLFPAAGTGVFYQINDEKMVVRADIAIGKNGNYGIYLKVGHPF